MEFCFPPPSRHPNLHQASSNSAAAFSPPYVSCCYIHLTTKYNRPGSCMRQLHRSFPLLLSRTRTWAGRCHATSPGPPKPPKLDPTEAPPSGSMSSLSKVQDAVRIFFAVLFWMSLFFWSCVWDGRNNGRPNKGSQFRR